MIENEEDAILFCVNKESLSNKLLLSRNLKAVKEQTVQIAGRRTFEAEGRTRRTGPGAGWHLASEPKEQLVWLE